jgi:hypothetical protein
LKKKVGREIIQVIQPVLLKIPDDMDQVTEDGAGTCRLTGIENGGQIMIVLLPEAAQVHKNSGWCHRGPLGIFKKRGKSGETLVVNVINHGSGKSLYGPEGNQKFLPGSCQLAVRSHVGVVHEQSGQSVQIIPESSLFLFSDNRVFRFIIVYKIICRSQKTVGRAGCPVAFRLPESSSYQDVWMLVNMFKIQGLKYLQYLVLVRSSTHVRVP